MVRVRVRVRGRGRGRVRVRVRVRLWGRVRVRVGPQRRIPEQAAGHEARVYVAQHGRRSGGQAAEQGGVEA